MTLITTTVRYLIQAPSNQQIHSASLSTILHPLQQVQVVMSYNQIIKNVAVGSIVKSGKELTLSVATKTSYWIRPDNTAYVVGERLKKLAEKFTGPLPEKTVEMVARYALDRSCVMKTNKACF
jgi:hypothetical protein